MFCGYRVEVSAVSWHCSHDGRLLIFTADGSRVRARKQPPVAGFSERAHNAHWSMKGVIFSKA